MDLVIYLYSIYYVLKFEFGCTCYVINLYSSCLLCADVVFGIFDVIGIFDDIRYVGSALCTLPSL